MVMTKLVLKFDGKEEMSVCRGRLEDTICHHFGFVVRFFYLDCWYLDSATQFSQVELRQYLSCFLPDVECNIWLSPLDTVFDTEANHVRLNYGSGYQWMPFVSNLKNTGANFPPSFVNPEWW